MARRERGILLDSSTILSLAGTEVRTFYGADDEYFESLALSPGDFISFSRGFGTDDAVDFKAATPNDAEKKKLAKPAFADAMTAARAKHAARLERHATAAATAAAKAAAPAAASDKAVIAPIVKQIVRLGLVPDTAVADLDTLTKKLVARAPLSPHGAIVRVLFEVGCRQVVALPSRMDAFFAGSLDGALADAPVRVANLAASFKTGFQIAFKTRATTLETSWFTSAHDVVTKLDAYLQQFDAPLRVYWLPYSKTERVVFIGTAAQATDLGATS